MNDLRVNDRIRIRELRVIDDQGTQLGVLPTFQALAIARERGLDLVEVAPTSTPPVAKIMDYGQFKYEQDRKAREAKRNAAPTEVKEVQLSVKIGEGDLTTKARKAREFLEEGFRVKVVVRFKGREITHPQLGHQLLTRFAELTGEAGAVDRAPLLEGKHLHLLLAPAKRRTAVPATKAA